MAEKSQRSRVPGGAEDEVLEQHPEGAHDPGISSRAKDALFADAPQDALPVPASSTEPPERHESGGPYDVEAKDATFFQARYDVDETNKKGGDQ
jgi:hypothetical protein